MDCREFREQHLAFVDNTLSDAQVVAMQRHLLDCPRCSRHDVALRRGLLVLRNLPGITPSSDFSARLQARLREAHSAELRTGMFRGPGVGSFFVASAAVFVVGVVATTLLHQLDSAPPLAMPPIVATAPEPTPMLNQGFVASASAGMPLWPAAMLAGQAPAHFATATLQLTSYEGSR